MQDPSSAQLVELKMPDPALPQLTVWPVTGTELLTVAVQVVLDPTATDAGSQETVVCVAAGCMVVGLKFAVIVPSALIVAVVVDDEGLSIVMDDELTVQPENA